MRRYALLLLLGSLSAACWGLGAAATLAYGETLSTFARGGGPMGWALVLGWIFLAMPPLTLAHELGHALASKLVRFDVVALSVTGVTFGRGEDGRWHLVESRRDLELGGGCYSLPRGTEGLRWRSAVVVAGGPLATAAVLLLVLGLDASTHVPRVLAPACWGATSVAALQFFSSLWPRHMRRTGQPTDGALLLGLLLNDRSTQARFMVAALYAACLGRGHREVTLELGEWVESLPFESQVRGLAMALLVTVLNHRGEFVRARALAARIGPHRSYYVDGALLDLTQQLACDAALNLADADAAQRALGEAPEEAGPFAGYLDLARSALALARGEQEQARTLLDGWLAGAGRSPQLRQGNEWILSALEARLQQAPGEPARAATR